MREMRQYISNDSRRKPIRISRGKNNSVPNVRILFTEVKPYCATGNPAGPWEKRMGMVIRVIERVVLEQNLPSKRVWTQHSILWVASHDIVAIDRRTRKSHRIPGVIISVRTWRVNRRNRWLLGNDR